MATRRIVATCLRGACNINGFPSAARRISAILTTVALSGGVLLPVSPAGAAVTGTTGAVTATAAPPSVKGGASITSTRIIAFDEAKDRALTSPLTVNQLKIGVQYNKRSALTTSQLPAGTTVHSHLLHAEVARTGTTLQGSATFDTDVLGVMVLDGDLSRSDAALGASGTLYPTWATNRGMEFADHPEGVYRQKNEWIRLVDARTVEVRVQLPRATADQIRVVTAATAAPPTPAPAIPTLSFRASGLDGGSIHNVVAVDPHGSGVALSGGDVAGIHRSTDWGTTWTAANTGISIGNLAVASIAFSPTTPGKVYAAVGRHGPGGVVASVDGGATWTTRSTFPRFSGVHGPTVRPIGSLFAFDGTMIYAGTYDQGVLRSTDDGKTWSAYALGGQQIRSLVNDPAQPSTLYAATWGGGVYRIDNGVTTTLSGIEGQPEELLVAEGDLFVATWSGVFRSTDRGVTWQKLATPGGLWLSLTSGSTGLGGTALYAGAANPVANVTGGGHASVIRSDDGGTTWTSVTTTETVHTTIGGPAGQPFWLQTSHPGMMLDGGAAIVNGLAVDPARPGRVILAGRADLWSTSDGGQNWYPAVAGLGATVNRSVVADPAVAGRVYTATADWSFLYSNDGLATVSPLRPDVPSVTGARSLAVDTSTSPATVYLGAGDNSANSGADVFSNTNPGSGTPWVSEGLGAATGGKQPNGLAVRRVNGTPVILAAVQGSGIWRKAGGSWSRVDATALATVNSSRMASFAWHPTAATVYLYDGASGVYRSSDNGVTWENIWTQTSPYDLTGYVAIDPTAPDDLYVSVALKGVYRLPNAATGTVGSGITAQQVGSFVSPGAMAFSPTGLLYVTEAAVAVPALHVSNDRGATWTSMGDDGYRAAAFYPSAISVAPDGTVYVSLRGSGVLKGSPA